MASRRNIRKRQFETGKSLRLYRDYESLYKFIMGEGASESNQSTFEANEKFDNNNKITEMFLKKKKNVIIPAINRLNDKDDKGKNSEKSDNTDVTQFLKKEDKGPIKFDFKPMGTVPSSYIKYKPKMMGVEVEQDYSKIDYIITEEDWNEIKSGYKSITESMRDLIEEIFDKFEKLCGKDDVQPLDICKSHIQSFQLMTKSKQPSDAQFRAIYNAWIALRKKHGNPLLRMFWKKPDPNDNSPNASFRSRVAEKIQTRRKNKNDTSNFMKIKLISKEVFAGRNLMGKVMEREKLKLAMLDLDYLELRQMLKRKTQADYKDEELKEFVSNLDDNKKVDFPKDLVEPVKSEDDEEMKEDASSIAEQSNATSKRGNRKGYKDSEIDQELLIGSQPTPKVPQTKLEHTKSGPQHSSQQVQDRMPVVPRQKVHDAITVDPTTVMQIAVMFKKFYYFGITADRNRIKINNHKPIKKEEYLNLSPTEIEEEQHQRTGVKPKPVNEVSPTTTKVKYMIFRARNGRTLIKRKPIGGDYEVMENNTHANFERIKSEKPNYLKRVRADVDAMDNFNKTTHIPVLQNEMHKRFKEFDFLEDSEPDEDATNDDSKEDEEEDDYTKDFIKRFRNRKGGMKKRGNNDLHIKVKV